MLHSPFPQQFHHRIDVRFLGKHGDRTIPDPCVQLWQVHSNRTIIARDSMESTEKADGVLTDRIGLHLIIRAADCQNFAVYDPIHHVCGVLHVGWRGILANTIGAFMKLWQDTYRGSSSELFVWAGPSLCLGCAEFADHEHILRKEIDPRYVHEDLIDLQKAATDQFEATGVLQRNIVRHPDCTRCHPERYFTYRGGDKEHVESGASNVLICTLH